MIGLGKWFGSEIKRNAVKFPEFSGLKYWKWRWEVRCDIRSEVCVCKRKRKSAWRSHPKYTPFPLLCIPIGGSLLSVSQTLLYPLAHGVPMQNFKPRLALLPRHTGYGKATLHILCTSQGIFVNFKYTAAYHNPESSDKCYTPHFAAE